MDTNPAPEEKKLDFFSYSSESTRRRKRTVFTKEQINILKNCYQKNPYPGIEEREELSGLTNIPEPRIHVWFQNRRARQSAQQKKQASEVSTSLRRMCLEDVSPGPILGEDFSEQALGSLKASRCFSWSGEPSEETGPRSGCSFEKRSLASTTEAACLCGYGISQSCHFGFSQTVEPSTELHPCALSKPISQGSCSQWASSWALQGTQGPENYNTHTSFYGRVKSPLHIQEQGWTVEQLYSKEHSRSFRCAEEPPHRLQQPHLNQPSALQPLVPQAPTFQVQQLTSSQHQSQELQDQTLPPPLKEEEQSYELFCSFNQQELHSTDVSKRTAGLGSTLLLPDGHLAASQGHLPAPQGHLGDPLRDLADHQGYLIDTQGHLAVPLENLPVPHGHLADPIGNLADIPGSLTRSKNFRFLDI